MSWGEEQQKEIETIRERKITVKLSDAQIVTDWRESVGSMV